MVHERVEAQNVGQALQRELGEAQVVVGVTDRKHDCAAAEHTLEREAAQTEPQQHHAGQQGRRRDPPERASFAS